MRELLERARNAKAQAKTAAPEHQRLDEALASASRAGVPADIVVEAVTVDGEANCFWA